MWDNLRCIYITDCCSTKEEARGLTWCDLVWIQDHPFTLCLYWQWSSCQMLILGAYHAQADHCQLKDFASVLQMGVSRQHHKCNFGLDSIKREASLGAPLLHLKMCAVTLQAKAQGKFAENHLCTNCKCKCNLNVWFFLWCPGFRRSSCATYRVKERNAPPG